MDGGAQGVGVASLIDLGRILLVVSTSELVVSSTCTIYINLYLIHIPILVPVGIHIRILWMISKSLVSSAGRAPSSAISASCRSMLRNGVFGKDKSMDSSSELSTSSEVGRRKTPGEFPGPREPGSRGCSAVVAGPSKDDMR